MGVTLRFPPDPHIYSTFTCLHAVHVARCACFRHLPVAQASRRFRVFASSIPSLSVLRFLLQCLSASVPPLPPACGLGALPASGWAPFPWIPAGAPRGVHWVPRMVALLSRSFHKVLFSFFVSSWFAASSTRQPISAPVHGLGRASPTSPPSSPSPTIPPARPAEASFVPAFQHSRHAFSSNSAADVGADCSIGEGSICSASSRSHSAALLFPSSAAPIFGARDSR